jgi:hypothetical protein
MGEVIVRAVWLGLVCLLGCSTTGDADGWEVYQRPAVQTLPGRSTHQKMLSVTSSDRAGCIDIDAEDAELADVMNAIGRRVGRNVLVDPDVCETVSVSLRGIEWREAVDVIARMARCEVEERAGGILLLTQAPCFAVGCWGDARTRSLAELLAFKAGYELVVADDFPDLPVPMPYRAASPRAGLEALAEEVGDYWLLWGKKRVFVLPR